MKRKQYKKEVKEKKDRRNNKRVHGNNKEKKRMRMNRKPKSKQLKVNTCSAGVSMCEKVKLFFRSVTSLSTTMSVCLLPEFV